MKIQNNISKLFLINFLIISYLEFTLKLATFNNLLSINTIYILLFNIMVSSVLTIIFKLSNEKNNKLVFKIVYIILTILYLTELVYYKFYDGIIGISGLGYTGQVAEFYDAIIRTIVNNIHYFMIMLIPIVLIFIFSKKIEITKLTKKSFMKLLYIVLLAFILELTIVLTNSDIKRLYLDTNNITLTTDKIGFMNGLKLDIIKTILPFEEKLNKYNTNNEKYSNLEYNIRELKLDSSTNKNINTINDYILNSIPSKKNEYTGIFKDMNLIFVVAESFYPMAIDEEMTPTLYKLTNEGFSFNNYYVPIYNCSTSDGELQTLYSLLPGLTTCSMTQTYNNYYPYSLGNIFKDMNYSTFAFHGGRTDFYNRNKVMPNLGYTFYACEDGLDVPCNPWPASDLEVAKNSLKYYINEDKFLAYYMTISGHLEYDFNKNHIANKNKELVDSLEASSQVKAYMSTQIELDKSMEYLLKSLEDSNKLDNTVIILTADHYPYGLKTKDIKKNSDYDINDYFDLYKNTLIIYKKGMNKVEINKYSSNLDILPTVLNLFGVDYDSRLLIGRDILSDSEGIIMFSNHSWITDQGKYNYIQDEYEAFNSISDNYISNINKEVDNKFIISKLILKENYYDYVFKDR